MYTRRYYALSAAAALIHYIEVMQNVGCSPHSIKVVFSTGKGLTRIGKDSAVVSSYSSYVVDGDGRPVRSASVTLAQPLSNTSISSYVFWHGIAVPLGERINRGEFQRR